MVFFAPISPPQPTQQATQEGGEMGQEEVIQELLGMGFGEESVRQAVCEGVPLNLRKNIFFE